MGKVNKTVKGNKKTLTKNKKQKLTQALAVFLVAATLLGTVAGAGLSFVGGGEASDEHAHYHDADGNTVHLDDIIQNPDLMDGVYYNDAGDELTVDDIIQENGIQFFDPDGNQVDIHGHAVEDADASVVIDLGGQSSSDADSEHTHEKEVTATSEAKTE